jgi:hypothetical protein
MALVTILLDIQGRLLLANVMRILTKWETVSKLRLALKEKKKNKKYHLRNR